MRNIEIIRLNKIKASIIITILLIGSISGVWAVTRTISGTQDNIETFIRNSNGKYWTATASGGYTFDVTDYLPIFIAIALLLSIVGMMYAGMTDPKQLILWSIMFIVGIITIIIITT